MQYGPLLRGLELQARTRGVEPLPSFHSAMVRCRVDLPDEITARLSALDDQIEKATGEARAKFAMRRQELAEDLKTRQGKLLAAVGKIID